MNTDKKKIKYKVSNRDVLDIVWALIVILGFTLLMFYDSLQKVVFWDGTK